MDDKIKKDLTCSRCLKTVENYSRIVYSQGDKVCTECKNDTLPGDKRAFDRDMAMRIFI